MVQNVHCEEHDGPLNVNNCLTDPIVVRAINAISLLCSRYEYVSAVPDSRAEPIYLLTNAINCCRHDGVLVGDGTVALAK